MSWSDFQLWKERGVFCYQLRHLLRLWWQANEIWARSIGVKILKGKNVILVNGGKLCSSASLYLNISLLCIWFLYSIFNIYLNFQALSQNLREGSVSFVIYVCLYVHLSVLLHGTTNLTWRIYMKLTYEYFSKICREILRFIKSDKNNG
jgi:hypothetical protein